MARSRSPDNEAFRRFLRRVWRDDVSPLLRDKRAEQRKRTARVGGKAAAAAGLLVDGLFRLRGRPFTRFMTVMGSSLGAMLPDAWNWSWLRKSASRQQRKVIAEQLRRQAGALPESEARAFFGLPPTATREDLKSAWRDTLQRWHPDKAPNEEARREYHLRFLAYKAAYERLCAAYDDGTLPTSGSRRNNGR